MTTEAAPIPPTKSRRWMFWTGGLVLMAALIGAGIWSWYRYRVWPEETRRLLERKNLAVAYLENEELKQSEPLFEQLSAECPNELLPARNLMISRLLALKPIGPTKEPEQFAKALSRAEQAVSRLKEVEGDTAVVNLLAGRLAELATDETAALEAYAKAASLAPENPAAWAELFRVARFADDPVRQIQARESLKKAQALRPDNLYLLWNLWMQQAALKELEIAETLTHARELLAPFREAILRRTGRDIFEYIDNAIAALNLGMGQPPDWGKVNLYATGVKNLMSSETATQRDLARISPHELEFIVRDFSPAFYKSAYLPAAEKSPAVPVVFQALEESLALPALTEVRDAKFVDFDLDGRLDVLVVRNASVEIFHRDQKNEWQLLASASVSAGMRGAIAADLDRDYQKAQGDFNPVNAPEAEEESAKKTCLDADSDLLVFGEAGMVILKNQLDVMSGQRTLEVVPQTQAFSQQTNILAAVFADLDQDGDLDVVASGKNGITLWLNRDNQLGAEGFDDVTANSGLPPADFEAKTLIPVDWDRNVTVDVLLFGSSQGKSGWLENLHHGRFRWQEFQEVPPANAAALMDADGNASWDLLTAGESGIALEMTNTPAAGVVRFLGSQQIADFKAEGLKTVDYDNDGVMDFVAWNTDQAQLFHGLAQGGFEPVDLFQTDPPSPAGCDVGDLDNDGDLDLLFFNAEGVSLFENEGGNANHWIDIALRADQVVQFPEQRCNMQGIGSLLELKAGSRYQASVVTGRITHFGLGPIEQADLVRVLWTNGIPANIIRPPTNGLICELQILKGSCPYLYTWDGERFVFATDLLWAAPIGLQFAEHQLAPAREWEYLRITGEQLQPKNGEYEIKITEELWEAGYLDQVELIAVDHPADVELYTNEKVAPPELAENRLRTVRNARRPIAARDQKGRDVLEKISRRDEDYLKAYDRRIKQGLTEEHFLELDVGELQNPKTITLYLTGWMYPTDTSLNVGIGQNPLVFPPRPPYLLVPDAQGDWREAVPSIGFPGGKTKTIAVDVPASLFAENDYRLRIATSMEIAWDDVFFTADEPAAPVQEHSLKLLGADLHYRGFSQMIPRTKGGPDRYDYESVSTASKWPPMMGRFTRYGDVAELINFADDRLVILGSGDEMTLKFQAPPPPPEGWTRTFVIHNVGWDKDADVNTVHGETVEPLPFRGMKRYPYESDQSAPDTPEYRSYLKEYQTREQSHAKFWKRLTSPEMLHE